MQRATGTVINGTVVLDGLDLPDGTAVTVLTHDEDSAVRLSPDAEAELLASLDEGNVEDGVSAEELFVRLQRYF